MKKISKSSKPKQKAQIKSIVIEKEVSDKQSVSFGRILTFIFKVITLPLYTIYVFLFKIPTDGPAPLVGLLRFVFFLSIGMYADEHRQLENFVRQFEDNHTWMPANIIIPFYAVILLWNLFLSFFEIWGLSTGSFWYDPFENSANNSISNYEAIEEGLHYRDTLLRADHTPGKIEELKKTGFMTNGRLTNFGSSPEVDSALNLLNSQMRAMNKPDKLATLKEMFGGAKA